MDCRRFSLVAVASAVAVCLGVAGCTASGAQAGRLASGPQAGHAQELPGLSALVPSGFYVYDAAVAAVSCTGPGDCVAGGNLAYARTGNNKIALGMVSFVAEERGGTWQPSRALAGLAARESNSPNGIQSLSCPSPGACVAAGDYGSTSSRGVFIVTERDGDWGTPIPVPGLARLTTNVSVDTSGLACWAAGNCVLAGSYGPASRLGPNGGHVFWASEVSGTWSPVVRLADPPDLGTGASAGVDDVACTRDGTCVIAATYTDAATRSHNVLATVTGGKLGTVTQSGQVVSAAVSCPPTGGCVAVGGEYGHGQAVAFTLHDRTWSKAPVPGLAAPSGLSCTGPGTCTVAGWSSTAANSVAVASEVAGTWQPTVVLPGAASLRNADLTVVSCADSRDCVAGGYADSGSKDANGNLTTRALIAVEKAGAWSAAQDVPGIAGLDGGRGSELTAIACPAPGAWTAGGYYDSSPPTSTEQFQGLPGSNPPFVVASAP
ncbi:MAG: hypothetical protein ABSA93_19515 [Streptosporangiaceae bacterium]